MKNIYVLSFSLFLMGSSLTGLACTSFMFPQSQGKVMGKNYDWGHSHGRIFANKKNVWKASLVKVGRKAKSKTWISEYASLTFNQIAEHFPIGGMNSQGLAVEVLLGPATHPTTTTKQEMSELQWIQYILDTSKDTKQAIAQAHKVDIIPLSSSSLHYFVCDKQGECAVFEYVNGKLRVSARDIPTGALNPFVLGNGLYRPMFLKMPELATAGPKKLATQHRFASLLDRDEPSEFVGFKDSILCEATKKFSEASYQVVHDEVTFAFETIAKVQAGPAWQIVYELANGRVHFRNRVGFDWTEIMTLDFKEFTDEELDCRLSKKTPSLRYDLASGPVMDGEDKYSPEQLARRIPLERPFFETREVRKDLVDEAQGMLWSAPKGIEKLLKVYNEKHTVCK